MNYSNNAYSVLASAITNSATSILVASGTGSRFPASNFLATLIGYDANGNENAWEIVLVTSRTGDALTVTRAQEGTTAAAWASATRIENRITAGTMAAIDVASGTTAQYWRGDKGWRDFATDVRAAVLAGLSTATNAAVAATDSVLVAIGKLQAQLANYLPLAGGVAMTGTLVTKALQETKVAMADNNIDLATGNVFSKTISGATTLTVSNVPASGTVATIILNLTNGGSATITWWSGVKWPNGTPPTLTTSGRDRLAFTTEDGGTTWDGFVLGKAMA